MSKTIFKNFSYGNVIEVGEYVNDLRSGMWKFHYNCEEMYFIWLIIVSDGGEYNEQGQKYGYWVELKIGVNDLIYSGEYDNAKKIGKWKICRFARNQKLEEM